MSHEIVLKTLLKASGLIPLSRYVDSGLEEEDGADGDMEKRKHEYLRFGKRKHEYLRFGKRKHEYLR